MVKISTQTVDHIAKLAKINLTKEQEEEYGCLASVIGLYGVIDELFKVDVSGVEPTHQITGLENILRDDKTDEKHH